MLTFYTHNIILYVERERLKGKQMLKREYKLRGTSQLSLVHPGGGKKMSEAEQERERAAQREERF